MALIWHGNILLQGGINVAPVDFPSSPAYGWERFTATNFTEISQNMPIVMLGTVDGKCYCSNVIAHILLNFHYNRLEHCEGVTHWGSGRMEQLQVNTQNLNFCMQNRDAYGNFF